MGKHNIKGQKNRKKNKEKNSKKKKRAKFKSHIPNNDVFCGKKKEVAKKTAQSLKLLCEEFSKLNHTASTRDIVRAKLRRDRRSLDKDLKDLCKTMNSMCNNKAETKEDGEEECFAEVENLAKNVNDLIISNDSFEPGFRFTRWQQRKFHQNVRKQKIKYNYNADEEKETSK